MSTYKTEGIQSGIWSVTTYATLYSSGLVLNTVYISDWYYLIENSNNGIEVWSKLK